MQHCWPTTPNIIGCYMLRPFAHPVHSWELLHPFAHHCQQAGNNSQHCCANNVGNCCVRLHAALGFCESLTGIKETLTLSSPCSTFSQALSLNSFAWTTWPETLQPREIMMPRDKGNVDQGANEGQGPQYHK